VTGGTVSWVPTSGSHFKGTLALCLINYALFHDDLWGSGGIAPSFLTSALDGGEWSLSRPGRFTPDQDRRLGGPQSRSGSCGEEPVAIPTKLSRLLEECFIKEYNFSKAPTHTAAL
jgi:hypothetical protein